MFQRIVYCRRLLWGMALLCVASTANGQTPGTTPLPDSIQLRTVVIQATRTGDKSPVPHTNLGADQIARTYQAQDIPYLLSGIPSLVESSDAGAGIGYTGMRIRGSDATRINVTLNGIPLNDAESQGMFWVDLPDLAASTAEIQVQRGVGTSTNGAGAFGATVNLDLSRVSPDPFAVLSSGVGSFGTQKHSAYLGTGLLCGKLAFSGRLSQIQSNGYVDRASAHLRSYHLTSTYIDDKQSFQAHLLAGQERTYQAWNGLPVQFAGIDSLRTYNISGTEKPGAPYADEVDNYTQRHYLAHYKRLFAAGLSLQANGHYTRGFGYYEQYKAGQSYAQYQLLPPDSLTPETDLIRQRWLDNHFYGLTYALRWAPPINPPLLSAAPVFLLGGALSRYEGRHFGEIIWANAGIEKGQQYYENEADKRDVNVFGKIELRFRGGWATLLDVQFRQVQYTFLGFNTALENVQQRASLHFFNPKAGLSWQFRPNWMAYAFYGIGHREPNRDDYTQSSPNSRPKPEQLQDLEAGLRWESERFSGALNFFSMHYKDQLVLDGRLNDVGAYIRSNVPRSNRTGLELEAQWLLFPSLRCTGSVAFSRNTIKQWVEYRDNWDNGGQDTIQYKNTDLAFSPSVIGRADLTWDPVQMPEKHRLSLSLSGKYVGKQFLDNTSNTFTALPAYFFSDFRINYTLRNWIGEELRIIFAVNNLANARYVSNGWTYRYRSAGYDDRPTNPYTQLEQGTVYSQVGYFPQAGRNVMTTLSLQF
ncbi:MAG: TonB-dependent receptor [Saprospiraceae bacterium]|nr:TonB-dependent receptor [Saprospiraceae bacterium]